MRRLREHQLVVLDVERPPASIECLVLAIDGDEATLQSVDPEQAPLIPTEGKNALLSFEYRSQLITLRGAGRRDGSSTEFKFQVTDQVTVQQRRQYARVDIKLGVTLARAGAAEPIKSQTRDLSAGGMLVEASLPVSGDVWRVELALPDGAPTLEIDARVVRNVAGGTALQYEGLASEAHERLKRFVAGRKREILANLRT